MQLGIGSYTFPWTLELMTGDADCVSAPAWLLRQAKELGVHVVQLCDNLPIPLHQMSSREIDQLGQQAVSLGLQLEIGTRGCDPRYVSTYIGLAAQLQSSLLRVVLDTPQDKPSPAEIVTRIRAITDELAHAGVTLAIENHDRFTAAEFAAIVQEIDDENVGICLDTVNSFGALEGPQVVVEALAPWTVNVHVKDFAVTRVANQLGFTIEGRPAGQGQLNVPWLLQNLAPQRKPVVSAIIELWTPPCADVASTAEREQKWAVESMTYLRSLIPG